MGRKRIYNKVDSESLREIALGSRSTEAQRATVQRLLGLDWDISKVSSLQTSTQQVVFMKKSSGQRPMVCAVMPDGDFKVNPVGKSSVKVTLPR